MAIIPGISGYVQPSVWGAPVTRPRVTDTIDEDIPSKINKGVQGLYKILLRRQAHYLLQCKTENNKVTINMWTRDETIRVELEP